MFGLFDSIAEWFRGLLIEGVISNFTGMFDELNVRVGEIAGQVGETPQGWNANVFNMIQTLSETVIVPIAGMILTFILCYELITMIIEKNNMHDFDTFIIFKWIFKTFCGVLILTNTFNLVMFVFGIAQNAINNSAGVIIGNVDMNLALAELEMQLETLSTGALLALYFESMLLSLAMSIISICVFLIIYGRMIEIYLTISVAPIPFSTMVNREWGNIGNSYLKSLVALAFQGFLIMVCVAIYAALLQGIAFSDNVRLAVWGAAGYSVLLCMILFKGGSMSKAIFGSGG
jgi:hypothetical protein